MNRKWYSIRTPAWKIRRRSFVSPPPVLSSLLQGLFITGPPSLLPPFLFPFPFSPLLLLLPLPLLLHHLLLELHLLPWYCIQSALTPLKKNSPSILSLLPSLSHRSFPKSSLTLSYLEPRGLRKMGCREERKGRILRMENSEQSPGLSTQTTSSLGHSLCLDLAPCLAQNTINIHLCGWLCVLISRVFLQMKSHKMK